MTDKNFMDVDRALKYADDWCNLPPTAYGASEKAFAALAAEVRRLRSPAVFDMDSAVEAFYAEIKRRYPDAYVEPDADTKADVSAGIAEAVNAAQPDMEALRRENVELVEILKHARRELDACQSVIHLAGGFDPAYVTGAKAVIKEIDAAQRDTSEGGG